jgi:hypothetical protein
MRCGMTHLGAAGARDRQARSCLSQDRRLRLLLWSTSLSGWMTTFRFNCFHLDPWGLLRSNGKACGTAFGAAPGTRTSASRRDRMLPLQFSSSDGIRRRQIEQMPTCARLPAMAFRATRDGHACRRSYDLARCHARAMASRIYDNQYNRQCTEAMAAGGKSAVQHGRKDPVRCALMCGL